MEDKDCYAVVGLRMWFDCDRNVGVLDARLDRGKDCGGRGRVAVNARSESGVCDYFCDSAVYGFRVPDLEGLD